MRDDAKSPLAKQFYGAAQQELVLKDASAERHQRQASLLPIIAPPKSL